MSRRMDREDVPRHMVQRHINEAVERELARRGLPRGTPCTVSDRFHRLYLARFYRYYRLWVLRRLLSAYERGMHLNDWRYNIRAARGCAVPHIR